ncbi:hypothetical protein [Lysinibacillus sphaericus]|uniref:hypothetical protein n=1 Tax=Lysinibacillus sphaericus TaxID=1421 RepID=UPI001A9CEFB5|nr:hypothetical protein [Lysinibacillus sphaericus]QTB25193.1 hypothetical protein J2D51_12540 [Lysinibacillus sphaericus]
MKTKKYFQTSYRDKENEEYFCLVCKEQIDDTRINHENWTCTECNEKIIIYSEIMQTYILRKYAYEVKRDDLIMNFYEKKWVKVKGINECDDDDFIMLGLEEYGGHITEYDDLVDCRSTFVIPWGEIKLFKTES